MALLIVSLTVLVYWISNRFKYFISLKNILLFALTCAVVFLLLRRLFQKHHPLLPLLATALFTVHPVHTEVVANIKSRDEILSFLNLSLSMLLMLQFCDKKQWWRIAAASVFFYLALLSKEKIGRAHV